MSPSEFDDWRKHEIERQEARKRSAERALAHLQSEHIWERYHEALGAEGWAFWRQRGISDSWVKFWQLGWRLEYRIPMDSNQVHITPSATIPLFGPDYECLNVKHRLLNPPSKNDRYRYELAGQEHPLFLCDPSRPLTGQVLAIEGEIKAMVTFATLGGEQTVIGLPGTRPGTSIIEQLKGAERVTLVMDPGAGKELIALAKQIGLSKCWGLIPPIKIDDGLLVTRADAYEARRMLASALRLSDYVVN